MSNSGLTTEFTPGTEITVRGVRILVGEKNGWKTQLSIAAGDDSISVKTPDGTITRFDKPVPIGTVVVGGKT